MSSKIKSLQLQYNDSQRYSVKFTAIKNHLKHLQSSF